MANIASIPGVDVAAPVAMIGYVTPSLPVEIDLSPHVTGQAGQHRLTAAATPTMS